MRTRFWSSAVPGLLMGRNSYAQPEMLFWWVFSDKITRTYSLEWMQAPVGCSVVFIKVGQSERREEQSPTGSAVFFVLLIYVHPDRLGSDRSSLGHCLRCLMWKHQTYCWRSKQAAWAWCSTAMLARPVTYWLLLSQTMLWRYSLSFLYDFLFKVLNSTKVLTTRCSGLPALGFRSQ